MSVGGAVTRRHLFAKCHTCDAVSGDQCSDPEGRYLNRPHKSREKTPQTNWSRWGYCPTCQQTQGAPCNDTRYPASAGQFAMKRPHKDRERPK